MVPVDHVRYQRLRAGSLLDGSGYRLVLTVLAPTPRFIALVRIGDMPRPRLRMLGRGGATWDVIGWLPVGSAIMRFAPAAHSLTFRAGAVESLDVAISAASVRFYNNVQYQFRS